MVLTIFAENHEKRKIFPGHVYAKNLVQDIIWAVHFVRELKWIEGGGVGVMVVDRISPPQAPQLPF